MILLKVSIAVFLLSTVFLWGGTSAHAGGSVRDESPYVIEGISAGESELSASSFEKIRTFFEPFYTSAQTANTSGSVSGGTSTTTPYEQSYLSERFEIGLEYGFENEEFQNILENAGLKITLTASGAPPNATAVVIAIKNQIDLADYADEKGFDFGYFSKAIFGFIEGALGATTGLGDFITVLKLTTTFLTAFTYGFMFGQ